MEPFSGGAALLFAKEPSKVEVINDVNDELVITYRVVKHHLEELVRQFKWALTSRKMFEWAKDTPPEVLTDIQRAARFLYLQHLTFSGVPRHNSYGTATTGRTGINLLRLEETLSQAHLRLHQVNIEHLDWAECMDRYDRPHTFFYLDPPYYKSADYGTPAPLEMFEAIAAKARTIKGKAIVSVSDRPEMREAFRGLPMEAVTTSYTVNHTRGPLPPGKELIIRSWE